MVKVYRITIGMFLLLQGGFAVADDVSTVREVQLIIRNNKPINVMNVHYQVGNKQHTYAQGYLYNIKPNETQYVYVNGIPSNETVVAKVDKMNVASRTVFNDPCYIKLQANEVIANIAVGFAGDPATHGSFTCELSKLLS